MCMGNFFNAAELDALETGVTTGGREEALNGSGGVG